MLRRLYLIVFFVIALLPKINIISVPGMSTGIRLEDFFVFIIVFLWFAQICIKKTKFTNINPKLKKITEMYLIYIFICIVSSLFGLLKGYISLGLLIIFLIRKIEYFIFIFIGYNYIFEVENTQKIKKYFNFIIIFHFIICILQSIGVIGSFTNGDITTSLGEGSRVFSTFNGPYELSAFVILILPMYIYELINKNGNKFFNIFMISIIFVSIYLSQSRTSIILFFAVFAIVLISFNKNNTKKIIYILLLLIVTLELVLNLDKILSFLPRFDTLNFDSMIKCVVESWKSNDFDEFMKTGKNVKISNIADLDLSFSIRVSNCVVVLKGWLKNIFFGMGLSFIKGASDCNYVRLLGETGLLGIIVYFNVIRTILSNSKTIKNIFGVVVRVGMYTLLLSALFIDVFEASKIMMFYWFVVGASYKFDELEQKNN